MSNPFRAIACAICPTDRGEKLILSNELNMTNTSQELIAYLRDAWILQCWGEILCKIGEVTQNLQGSTEVPELTLAENSVFLGSGLSALDFITWWLTPRGFTVYIPAHGYDLETVSWTTNHNSQWKLGCKSTEYKPLLCVVFLEVFCLSAKQYNRKCDILSAV